MEGDGEGVQVSVESSWTVLKGSLESCVSVIFLDPDTHEPIISSSPHTSTKLVLVPPAQPVPCEITVKFQGRLCHVQSLYSSSTARICEIYSRSKLETDSEYVCTVKGWIPCKDDFSSADGTEINLEEDSVTKRGDEVLVKSCSGSDCSNDGVHEGVMSSDVSSTTYIVDDECQKSVCSSGEGSWVNVKMNGIFSAESASVSLMAPDLDNWHVPLNAEELVHLEDQLGMASRGLEGEGRAPIGQDMFEAEVELLDHDPWAAITIRLLSLQDKSVVEVDQIVFLAISGPVAEPAASAGHSNEKEPTSALFAMFLPSILQMARGVSGKNKDLSSYEISSRPCEEKQDLMDVAHAGKEEVCKEFCPSLAVSVAECASSTIGLSPKLEEAHQSSIRELHVDGNISKRTEEPGNEVLQPGLNHNPVCNCKGFSGDATAKEVAATFKAFSERFDRLESLCLRMESFLHKTFESLDERITRLEVQNIKGSGETGSMSKHSGTLLEVQMSYQDHPRASEPKEEGLSVSTESAVQDDSEMQHQSNNQDHTNALPPEPKEEAPLTSTESRVKEHSEVNSVFSRSADIENDVPSVSQELSSEPEVMVISMASKDKEPHVSLDDAWASALSAFASSLPALVADNKSPVGSVADEQLLGSSHIDGSVSRSHCSKELKEDGIGSSSSSTPEFQPVTLDFLDFKGMSTKELRSDPAQELAAGVESIDCIDDTEGGWDSSLLNCFDAHGTDATINLLDLIEVHETDATINLLDLIEVKSSSHDVDVALSQALSQQTAQPSSPQFDVFSSAHSNTMLFGETLDDWAALGELKTRSLPLFKSSSVESQGAVLKSKSTPHNMCNPIGDSQEKANFGLFGGALEYDFFQQRSLFSSMYAESCTSYAEKSEEESLCNASLELDFLSGHILSEKGEAASITEVLQANGFPDLLENSQDGRTCSEDSMCFSQDFDAGSNDLSDKRWSCSPNIFYMHDPELTDDEADNTAGCEDERTDTSDSVLQGDLSDTDSTQDSQFWSSLQHNARNNEQPAVNTVFRGFENI